MSTSCVARDLFIGNDCVSREVNCLHFGTMAATVISHADIDYQKPNDYDCWHCCSAFDNVPVPICHDYDIRTSTIRVSGNFCSLACAKAHLLETPAFDTNRRLLLLRHVATTVYGMSGDIVAAPPRMCLKRFGGTLDLDSYRQNRVQCNIVDPPFVSHTHHMQTPESTASRGAGGQSDMQVEPAGQRGLYFDFLKKHDCEDAANESRGNTSANGSLSRFLRRSEGKTEATR